MATEQLSTNLWVRANMHEFDVETAELIYSDEQQRYEAIVHEIGAAGMSLNEAYAAIPSRQQRLQRAYDARDQFFREQGAFDR